MSLVVVSTFFVTFLLIRARRHHPAPPPLPSPPSSHLLQRVETSQPISCLSFTLVGTRLGRISNILFGAGSSASPSVQIPGDGEVVAIVPLNRPEQWIALDSHGNLYAVNQGEVRGFTQELCKVVSCMTANEKWIVMGTRGRVAVVDQKTRETVARICLEEEMEESEFNRGFASSLMSDVAVCGDEVAAVWDNNVVVFKLNHGKDSMTTTTRMAYAQTAHRIMCVAVSAKDEFVTACADGSAQSWSKKTNQKLVHFHRHTSSIYSLCVSKNGSIAVSGSGGYLSLGDCDFSVRVWHTQSGQEMFCFRDHMNLVSVVNISENREIVQSAGWDGVCMTYDIGIGNRARVACLDDKLPKDVVSLIYDYL